MSTWLFTYASETFLRELGALSTEAVVGQDVALSLTKFAYKSLTQPFRSAAVGFWYSDFYVTLPIDID